MRVQRKQMNGRERLLRFGMTCLTLALLLISTTAPVAAEHDKNDGLDPATGAYVSVQFLYVFNWEGSWEPERDLVKVTPGESDLLTLYNGAFEFQAVGLITDSSAEEVLELAIESVETAGDGVEILGQDSSAEAPNATVAYEGTPEGSQDPVPMIGYIEIQEVSLVDGSGTAPLILGLFAPADDFAEAWDSATREILRDFGLVPLFLGSPVMEGGASEDGDEGGRDADEDSDAAEGASYTSPTYGYAISWDEEVWTVEDEKSRRGEDTLELSSDNSSVLFTGSTFATDAEECLELAVEELLEEPEYEDFSQAVSGSEETPYEGEGVLGSYTGYTDGETALYLECAELPSGDGVLLIRFVAALDEFPDELELFNQLLGDVELEATDDGEERGDDAAEGGSYTDPDFGWSLTWDETWSQSADPAKDGYLGLDNGRSLVVIYPVEDYAGDSEECLADQVARLEEAEGVSRVRAMEVDGEPVQGGDAEAAYAAYRYRYRDSESSSNLVDHFDCRTLVEGEAVLVSVHTAPVDDYETEAEAFAALLGGLELDGGASRADDGDTDDSDSDTQSADAIAGDDARMSDTPAMLLRADDLADLGFEEYGVAFRSYRGEPLLEDVTRIAIDLRVQPGEVTERLTDAGLKDLNVVIYGYPDFESEGTPDIVAGAELVADVTSYVVVYLFEGADEESAEAIYALLTDTSENDDVEEIDGTQTFGDESVLTRVEWNDPDDEGGIFHSIDATFRAADLVGEVRLQLPIEGDEPTVAQIESLAERFLERIEATRAGEAPGLSNLVLRFDDPGAVPLEQRYTVLDGDYDEIAGVLAEDNQRTYEETLGAPVHMYVSRQYYSSDPNDLSNGVSFRAAIFVYDDAAAATAYLGSVAGKAGQDYVAREAPALGDEALAYTRAETDYNWNDVYVRMDNVVIRVQVGAVTPAPDDVVDDLAAEQLACLDAGACEPIRVPEGMRALEAAA